MILWCDGAHDPAANMARDAALLAAAEAGAEPVLRLSRFAPHGITLGYGQDPAAELDLARCARDGVPWARRPTGGRAIFHAEEWTYALAAPLDDAAWGGTLDRAYGRAADLVLGSLRRLGVPARRNPRGGGRAPRRGRDASPPCFASRTGHEIVLGAGKLVGSAQRRTARGLLQQGSVLLGPGHLRLADYAAIPDARRAAWRADLGRAAADAGAHLGADAPLERWADALAAELGRGVRRRDGAEGGFLLIPPERGSYTARPS